MTRPLVVRFLDQPYENKSGSIKPTAMTRRLDGMKAERASPTAFPCDDVGRPRSP